jgi:DDE superfamily endonuclease/Helix-turn-helix of DDE superfamily endonuclease
MISRGFQTRLDIIKERPLRYYRTTGLTQAQMQELVLRVQDALPEPWDKKTGRPKSCDLYRAVEIACMYVRQNSTQEFLGDLQDISQSTVSRIVTVLVPIIKTELMEFVPTAQEAVEMVQGRVCLVDGTITPCWSYDDHDELWSRKHGTTGFNVQLICLLDGYAVYISDPLPGCTHDAKAFTTTPVAEIVEKSGGGIGDKGYQGCGIVTPRKTPHGGELSKGDKANNAVISALRAPVERIVAHFKSWRIFHTDYRRPYRTYREAYDAARGLFFFSITWGFE